MKTKIRRNHYLLPFAAFLVLVMAIMAYALSRVEDKEPIKQMFIVQNDSGMQIYRVDTEPYEPIPPAIIDTPERYDKKYLEYLDKQQQARDRTFGGR